MGSTQRYAAGCHLSFLEGVHTMLKKRIKKDFSRYGGLYLLVIPVVVYYIIFHYIPMGGVLMAFEDFVPRRGVFKSDWVGVQHFITFFNQNDSRWRDFGGEIPTPFLSIHFAMHAYIPSRGIDPAPSHLPRRYDIRRRYFLAGLLGDLSYVYQSPIYGLQLYL